MNLARTSLAVAVAGMLLLTAGVGNAGAEGSRERLKTWLDAAAVSNVQALSKLTSLPFEFRTTNKKKSCEGVVTEPAAFAVWTKCFRKTASPLVGDVKNGGGLGAPSSSDAPPKEFSTFVKRVKAEGTWEDATVVGDGFTVWFRYLVTAEGKIAALLLDWGFYE